MRRFWILFFVLLFIFANSALAERTVYADQGGVAVFMEDGKVGLVDSHGDVILPAEYDKIGLFGTSEWAKLSQGDQYGVVCKDGHVPVGCAYDGIFIFHEAGMAQAYQDIDYEIYEKLIDLKTGMVLMDEPKHVYRADAKYVYDLLVGYNDGWETSGPYRLTIYGLDLSPLLTLDGAGHAEPLGWGFVTSTEPNDGIYTVIDLEGNTLLEGITKYEIASEGVYYVRRESTKTGYWGDYYCGLLNMNGIAFEVQGTEIGTRDDAGLYCVNTIDGYQYFDSQIIPGDCYGYVDDTGAWIIGPKYKAAGPFVDGSAIVCENGRYHLIDPNGRQIGDVEWSKTPCMTSSVIAVDCDGGLKLIDRHGIQVNDEVFAGANLNTKHSFRGSPWDTYGDYMLLRDQMGRLCVIEADGTVCLRLDAEDWNSFLGDGSALWVETGGLWGLVELGGSSSSPGSWRISPRFTMVDDFGIDVEGVVYVTFEDGCTAEIDAEGNPYAPLRYYERDEDYK